MAESDLGFKIVAREAGQGLCRLAGLECHDWTPIGDTLQAVERLADRAFKARIGPDRCVVYFEAYTRWKASAPWNMLAKSGLLAERERLPVVCLAFILTPEGYSFQGGSFSLSVDGHTRQQLWYDEVPFWEQKPEPWWKEYPGLLSLMPLVNHGKTAEEAVNEAAQGIRENVSDTIVRADLLSVLGFFGQMASPGLEIFKMITEEEVLEASSWVRGFWNKGFKEGRKDSQVKLTVKLLTAKFGPLPAGVQKRLAAMTSSQLDKLAVRLLKAKSLRSLGLEE